MRWEYAWEAPKPNKWNSEFSFNTHEAARHSAVWHALNAHKRTRPPTLPLETKQEIALWRSMRKDGWRIRRRKKNIE